MIRPIAISLSPNTQADDFFLSLRLLFNPKTYFSSASVTKLEKVFSKVFGGSFKALALGSGRDCLYLILKTLKIGLKDEVIIQPFTCVAVANAVIWSGATPKYVDVDGHFNINIQHLTQKINKNTKAVIVQNTFGLPCDYDGIKKIIKIAQRKYKSKIYLIEDCAHALGSLYKGKKLGTLGDIAFFSFGRDKVLSGVGGGVILTSKTKFCERILSVRESLEDPTFVSEVRQLLHPILFMGIILPLYLIGRGRFTVGKVLLFLFQRLKILDKPVSASESLGIPPKVFLKKMCNSSSSMIVNQLRKLEKYNNIRKAHATKYIKGLKGQQNPKTSEGRVWLRYPLLVNSAGELIEFAKAQGILLGDWYRDIIQPSKNLSLFCYKMGECPKAEAFAKKIVNLPTYPAMTEGQVKKVIRTVNLWTSTKQK